MISGKVFENAKWIIVCKIAQSLIQMLIGMISARYLGPSNYGLVNYAASVVAFAVPIMQLGLSNTLVQEFIGNPDREGEILGTGLAMNILSSVACIVGIFCFLAATGPDEKTTIIVCVLYSTCLFFQALEMIRFWFQAKLLSKYSSLASLGAYVVVSAYKIYLLVTEKSVYWFALSHTVEYAAVSALMLIVYYYVGGSRIHISWKLAKTMFAKSKYYILANMMLTIFQNTDHVMLKLISGNAENGYYVTAITCAGVTGFVYMAIIDSARPVILESKKESQDAFENQISSLYSIMIFVPLIQSLVFTIFARPIVLILYGREYMQAVPVLRVLVWMLAFSYLGSVRNIWILATEQYSMLWKINLCGVIANVLLNAILIPLWGACGAALASVVTQFVTNFVVGFFMKSIRRNNTLLLRGLNPRYILELASGLKK